MTATEVVVSGNTVNVDKTTKVSRAASSMSSEATMTSLEISVLTGKEHKNVLVDIRNMLDGLGLGGLALQRTYKSSQNKDLPMFALDRHLTLVLVTGYNVALRSQVISRWTLLENEREAQIKARSEARMEYRPMTAALVEFRSDAGKETKAHHYSNEADLINRIVLGSPASKFRVNNEIDKEDSLRDFLTKQQIIAIQHLQKTNTALIEIGMDFQERKDRLIAIYNKKHNKLLINEQLRLEA